MLCSQTVNLSIVWPLMIPLLKGTPSLQKHYSPLNKKMNLPFNICSTKNRGCFPTFGERINVIFFVWFVVIFAFTSIIPQWQFKFRIFATS